MTDKTRIMIGTADVTEHVLTAIRVAIEARLGYDYDEFPFTRDQLEEMLVVWLSLGQPWPEYIAGLAELLGVVYPDDPGADDLEPRLRYSDDCAAIRAEAIRVWRAQVQAKARAMRDDAEEGPT